MSKEDEPRGSFIRWQSITIAQLTYAVNLILGFSVATLAFQITLLLNNGFVPASWQKCSFTLSLVLLLVSVGLGLWCVINRLRDFRATTKVARKRKKGASEFELEPLRNFYRALGRKTWGIFWWQVGTFGVGVLLTVISVGGSVASKLI
ncbi:hypothetical protein SAMN05216379_12619 [Nitrosomonas eutropha]|uniref:hypothetical protein n=1 Tax=Nitrosomonas eutropha TaxID=916 RepID=UPI00088B4154|nr:hypothetical protein [Nitrosomonas eutropha]SCX25175.1 hypothetical protein SAMN05216379_12619 [Nitrosomonas eutropha]